MWLRATESPWLRATESTGYALVEILVPENFPRSHLRRQPQTQRRDYPYLIQAEGECFSPGSVTTLQPRGFVPLVFWFCNRLSFLLCSLHIYSQFFLRSSATTSS
jgi:hypothetical protein